MSQREPLTVVFDCMVFLQAAISSSVPSGELLRFVERGEINVLISRDILQELKSVISRQNVTQRYSFLTTEFVEDFLTHISQHAKFVTTPPPHFSYARDRNDEKYINLAIEAGADYLVSRDKDLRDLMSDYSDDAKDFRQRFRHLKIVNPVEFLRVIRQTGLSLSP